MGETTKVAKANDLAPGKAMCVEVAGQKVALFNLDGSYYAIGDSCTHVGGPLSDGEVDGKVVTCPLHGAQFDVTTGGVLGPRLAQMCPATTCMWMVTTSRSKRRSPSRTACTVSWRWWPQQ